MEASLAQRGYRMWRSSYTMEVALDGAPPKASGLPPPFRLRRYRRQDEESLRGALNEAFARDPFHHEVTKASFRETYLGGRGFDPSLWLLAWDAHDLRAFSSPPPSAQAIPTSLGYRRSAFAHHGGDAESGKGSSGRHSTISMPEASGVWA